MRRKCGKPSSPLRILFFGAQFADVFLRDGDWGHESWCSSLVSLCCFRLPRDTNCLDSKFKAIATDQRREAIESKNTWKVLDQSQKWKIQVNISDFSISVISKKKSENYGQKVWKKCQKQICEGVLQRVLATRREIGEIASDLHTWAHPPRPNLRKKIERENILSKTQWCLQNWRKKHYYASEGPAYIYSYKLLYIFLQQFKLGKVKVTEKSHNEIFKRSVAAPLQFSAN